MITVPAGTPTGVKLPGASPAPHRLMGIATVAVYADGDRDAPYVREADRAVALGGRSAAETYLDIGALLAGAEASGADAVHPGYGFLSERAAFARAVIDAGLTWVGPPPDVIDAMGDKLTAKKTMSAAGVPVLPSWDPDDGGVRFPVLVKAAAGGGGKGMRVVAAADDLPEAVAAARREAEGAFGEHTVFLERYLTSARHVEIQILADDHGNLVHCFERECSIQRRHQKIDRGVPFARPRRRECGSAWRGRRGRGRQAVGYRNAGTVEFVVEPSGDFWFLEVNTRLQVEHPVTEAVTGVDLVREQIRSPQGRRCRSPKPTWPSTGTPSKPGCTPRTPPPGSCPRPAPWSTGSPAATRSPVGLRGRDRHRVGVEFDPMLAKVIAHAPTRAEAASRLALVPWSAAASAGVTTNRDFLVATLRHPEFLAGHTTTGFIERSGVPGDASPSHDELRVAATAAALFAQAEPGPAPRCCAACPAGGATASMPPRAWSYGHGGPKIESATRPGETAPSTSWATPRFGDGVRLSRRLDRIRATWHEGWVELGRTANRHRVTLHVFCAGDRVWVQGPDGDVALTVRPRFPEAEREAVAGGLVAPMPGQVLSVAVAAGDAVTPGQLLMIMEAMKMEHRITAPHAGVVGEVRAHAGDQVAGGDLLVVLAEPVGAATGEELP